MARSRNRIWILAASIAGCFLHARLVAAQEPAAAANANDEVERAEVSASENLAAETNVAPEGNVAGEDAESTADEETATSEPATEDNGVRGETHDNDRAPSMLLATPRAESHSFQLLIPPFLRQESREVTTTVFFPFVHLRESRAFAEDGAALPGTSELLIPPIYHREGPTSGDVVFPFFWFFRDQEGRADVAIPPVYSFNNRRGHDSGFFPFFFTGEHDATVSATDSAASTTRVRRSYYHLIPPLLTAAWGDANEDYLFATLAYRIRQRGDERFGFFPLVWFRNSPTEHYQIAAPLFGRYQTPTQTWTVVPPALFYLLEKPNESFAGVFGLVHHNEGPGHHSTTIPPLLFHFSEAPNTWRLVTPLFLSMHENGTDTFATWLYQRYRGVTEFDGVLPVFANYRDPRDGTHMTMATPLVWSWGDPGNDNWLVLPFAGSFHRHGREQTTLIAPNIQISQWHDGNAFNIYPLWFYENVTHHRHIVLAPFWWDFENFEGPERTRTTLLFPFSYYRHVETRDRSRWEWEIHVLGLFDYGEKSTGEYWWRVLYGLAGHEHRLHHDRDWIFYGQFDHAHPERNQPAEDVDAVGDEDAEAQE